MTTVDDFMSGSGGYPLIKINSEGGKLVGDLVEARLVDERDYNTGEIVRWDNGEPRKQLVLDVRVDWDASADVTTGKDGTRDEIGTYYCRYTAFLALKEACDKANTRMSQVDRLALARTKDGVPRKAGFAPPQQFVAKVTQRAAGVDVDDLLAEPAQPEAVSVGVSADDLL